MTHVTLIDPELSQRCDTSQPMPEIIVPVTADFPPARHHLDISGALKAVQVTASALSTMEMRIDELEAHLHTLEASIQDLDAQGELLAAEISDITQHRDSLTATLSTESERRRRLETFVAQQVTREIELERDLGSIHADFARIVEAVTDAFGPLA